MASQHRVQSDMEAKLVFTDTFTGIGTPEGFCFGHGNIVGNGVDGWAPGALFVDTDSSEGSLIYKNTGSITSATWTELTGIVLTDTSNYWAVDTIEAAMAEIGKHFATGTIDIPIILGRTRSGALPEDYLNASRDYGFGPSTQAVAFKSDEIASGDELTQTYSFVVPTDWKVSAGFTVEVLATSDETVGTPTIDLTAYFVGASDVNNDDLNTTSAIEITDHTNPEALTFTCSAIPSKPGAVTLNLLMAGNAATDKFTSVYAVSVYYTRAFLT